MSRKRWHIDRQDGCYTLARHWPPRFDVCAEAMFPSARRGRLAQQVRQDLWRALRHLRGFSPVIVVSSTEGGLSLRAGGRALGPIPPGTEERIAALLTSPAHRARWLACAQHRHKERRA